MANPSADLLLQTKIRPPRLKPQLVERAGLLRRLDDGLAGRVYLLSAPAGYGKTCLLTQWIADQPAAGFSWLALDAADNSLERFLRYLIAALQKNLPEAGAGALAMLSAPLPPDPATLLAILINDLEAHSERPLVLVLDDLHVISERAIFDLLDQLIERQPECLRVVLCGRADPPLRLAGLRASADLTELRAADLRFSTTEAAVFLKKMLGITLQPSQVAALEQRTEGWIAGLQLAALSMRDRKDVDQFIRVFTGSHRFILDYLADEVLRQQPDEIQQFLLRTSVLDRFTADLCDDLLKDEGERIQDKGNHRAAEILATLEQNNLFLIPLDDTRTWYRYHTLFADLLRFRLSQADPGGLPGLHRRAAEWFRAAGLLPEAVQHATAAGDFAAASAMVEEACEVDLNTGQVNRVLGWLDTLPAAVFNANPRLHLLYVFGLFSRNQFVPIEPRLVEAERGVAALPEAERAARAEYWRTMLVEVTACRAILSSMGGSLERTIQLSTAALEGLPDDYSMRPSVLLGLAVAYRLTGKIREAEETLRAASESAQAGGQGAVAIVCLCNHGDMLNEMGCPDQAVEDYRAALRISEQHFGSVFPVNSLAFAGLAETAFQRGDLAQASELIEQALQMDELWGNGEIRAANLSRRLRFALAAGDSETAKQTLAELRAGPGQGNRSPHVEVAVLGAEIATLEQLGLLDETTAASYIQKMDAYPPQTGYMAAVFGFLRAWAYRSQAHLTGRTADLEHALALAEPVAKIYEQDGLTGRAVEARALLAALLAEAGQAERARTELRATLDQGAAAGFVMPFASQGAALQRLLASLLPELPASTPARALAERVLTLAGKAAAPTRPAAAPTALPGGETLSEREVEVLALAERGLSNSEIAARLTLAPGTVKRHMHNIFEKLDAASRPEAIHKARAAGLLE